MNFSKGINNLQNKNFKDSFSEFIEWTHSIKESDDPQLEERRFARLMKVADLINKSTPIISGNPRERLGRSFGTGLDVSTFIYMASFLHNSKNFEKILNELKNRGIDDIAFSNAALLIDQIPYNSSRTAKYLQLLIKYSKGKYDRDFYENLRGKREKSENPLGDIIMSVPIFSLDETQKLFGLLGISFEKVMSVNNYNEKVEIETNSGKIFLAGYRVRDFQYKVRQESNAAMLAKNEGRE
ncbi:MAG: hypothetical protein LBD50_00415 [Rickettsiales bacterium]|jgi:hypothetical protein|nr:hypothetical protein [Rickettsiales bacterium]